jgi:transcription elongation factor Elf1
MALQQACHPVGVASAGDFASFLAAQRLGSGVAQGGPVKLVAYALAAALGGLGLVFVAGNQGLVARIIVGIILLASAVALVAVMRLRPGATTVVQKVELGGGAAVNELTCKNCGAQLAADAVSVRGGSAFVTCKYCGTTYQLDEKPRW